MSYQEKAGWVRPTVETMGTRKTMVGSIPFTVETVDLDGNPVHNDSGAS